MKISYIDGKKSEDAVEGIYEKENDKVIFEISQGNKNISIFNIKLMM